MKIKKSFLSVCLSISLMFGCFAPSITAYAVGDSWSDSQKYTYFQNNFDDINTRFNGIIINQNNLEQDFEVFLQEYRDNYNIPSGTSNSTWISDNINATYQTGSSGNSDITFSQDLIQVMRDWVNAYIESNTGYIYCYSYTAGSFLDKFSNQDLFHSFLDVLNDNDSYIIQAYNTSNSWNIPPEYLVVFDGVNFVKSSIDTSKSRANVKLYYEWNLVSIDNVIAIYHNSNGQYVSISKDNFNMNNNGVLSTIQGGQIGSANSYRFIVSQNQKIYQVYKTLDSLKAGSEGIQEYYSVNGSYNDTVTGSYNTTTNNIRNTLTNNDVSNYINNYYVENGAYPSSTQINVYIDQHINEGSGGSGSGGSGSGGNNNPNWDFGFLGTIGELLAQLISGLGEIVGGILSAITSIISSLREGIPNTIGLFLEWFFPFLPTEIVALIELSILCAVILGVVRLIRGH